MIGNRNDWDFRKARFLKPFKGIEIEDIPFADIDHDAVGKFCIGDLFLDLYDPALHKPKVDTVMNGKSRRYAFTKPGVPRDEKHIEFLNGLEETCPVRCRRSTLRAIGDGVVSRQVRRLRSIPSSLIAIPLRHSTPAPSPRTILLMAAGRVTAQPHCFISHSREPSARSRVAGGITWFA